MQSAIRWDNTPNSKSDISKSKYLVEKEKQKIKDNGSIVCQKCGAVFHDGSHKCPRCGAHVAYVGGSFFDNWPLLMAACFISVAPYLLSIGVVAAAIILVVLAVASILLRTCITKIRIKNKMIVRRELDFQLWMMAFLVPALMLAYSLADIEIAYK